MKKPTFFIVATIAMIILNGCATSQGVIDQSVSETIQSISASTVYPTCTPYPTYTVQLTYTPYPTYTSQPTQEPLPTQEPEAIVPTLAPDWTTLITFTGDGKGTTDLFSVPDSIIRVSWNYFGSRNFALYIRCLDNDTEEMLENAIGMADGQSIFAIDASDSCLFDIVMASGAWVISVDVKQK